MLANVAASAATPGVALDGHYIWTYGRPGRPARAMRRLFLAFGFGAAFVVSRVALAALLRSSLLAFEVAAVLGAPVMSAISFGARSLWAFLRSSRERAGDIAVGNDDGTQAKRRIPVATIAGE